MPKSSLEGKGSIEGSLLDDETSSFGVDFHNRIGWQRVKVLWVTNKPIGEAGALMSVRQNHYGGWLDGALTMAATDAAIQLTVAFPLPAAIKVIVERDQGITYFGFPAPRQGWVRQDKLGDDGLREILDQTRPDLVHVFGTEFLHSNRIVRLCEEKNIPAIVQIQGLMGAIRQHLGGWLPERILRRGTLVEWARGATLRQQARNYANAATVEADTLSRARHVIGRTTFDRAFTAQLNPEIRYHHCNESLREVFYHHQWSLGSCDRNSIFISQASIPYKGAHQLFAALPIVLSRFPDARVRVAGPDQLHRRGLRKVTRSSYSRYLGELIRELGLQGNVEFVGELDQDEMCSAYLRSHVFVSCSSIENESNSLSEAKLLGMPVVASFVGGVTDRVAHGGSGFAYQGDASYMLAHYICRFLSDDDMARSMGAKARDEALSMHDRPANHSRLKEIYASVLEVERISASASQKSDATWGSHGES